MERVVTRDTDRVNAELHNCLEIGFRRLLEAASGGLSPRWLEQALWVLLLELGRQLLAEAFAQACVRATNEDWRARGFEVDDGRAKLRLDADYKATLTTTVGSVEFPLYAYRDESGPVSKTRVPAREDLFALSRHVHSSELCLEFEALFGSDSPFRQAEQTLAFVTHGAVPLADNTINRHTVAVSRAVERRWLYRSPAAIRDILRDRATRDTKSDKPILYLSSDAHNLRRYVDETWSWDWKCANGIRLWCVDRDTGKIVHIGGEFTWGDCREVGDIFADLIRQGVLPGDADYGDGVVAQYVWLSDGMPWFDDHVHPLLEEASIIRILDVYHVLKRLRAYVRAVCGRARAKAGRLVKRLSNLVLGKWRRARRSASKRRGPRKNRRRRRRTPTGRFDAPPEGVSYPAHVLDELERLHLEATGKSEDHDDHIDALLDYLRKYIDRIDYRDYAARGFQIGSGAMESLHRSGSQVRTKVPGARWLRETCQAIFDLRMLRLVGNWAAFWNQDNLRSKLVDAFSS